ncbi:MULTISPECIES: hypothetical protein [unclassified Nonomuraea]|uniref:hypothetical protein n=1 Tax=unclassified Nonomuraea TaxID=2593643 RepID=UPI0033D76AE1
MTDGAYFTWAEDGFTLEILRDGDGDPSRLECCDAIVTLPSGERCSALLLTLEEVGRIMGRHARSGESLGGRYWCALDLVVIREAGVAGMVDVIRDLVDEGDIFTCLPRIGEGEVLVKPEM